MKVITAACIVAHPDDETIWMGGTILQKSEWKWTIFSLCRANDKDRMPKFRKVCKIYRAEAIISDLDDEKLRPLQNDVVQNKILKKLPMVKYNYLFTHGENGEYGHIRHKEIHKAVKNAVRKKNIKCDKLFFFSYESGVDKMPTPSKSHDLINELSEEKFKRKIFLITNVYGFADDSFEARSCGKTEAFVEL